MGPPVPIRPFLYTEYTHMREKLPPPLARGPFHITAQIRSVVSVKSLQSKLLPDPDSILI
eukprot:5905080-Pyramimonas_sp.AAC.1